VPQGLVVGIFPGADASSIDSALSAQQIDLTKVKVVRRSSQGSDDAAAAEDSAMDFIDVFDNMEDNSLSDDMTKGMGIMGDAGGTGVPGLGTRGPSLGSFSSQGGTRTNYLAALRIPTDEADNFNAAIDEGRAVVAYPEAGADAATVAAAFKAAGLRNVRTY
jgi:rhodanese-related sulfurtransferase